MPTGDAHDAANFGPTAGVTATFMEDATVGVGLDLAYHHWPGSSNANSELDRFWSSLSRTTITGSKWTFSAIQATGHVKVAPPMRHPIAPWLQVGAGAYSMRTNLELPVRQLRAAGWQLLEQNVHDSRFEFGYFAGGGFNLRVNENMKLGMDATYHLVLNENGPNFTVFTFGASTLFGQW